jgi:hypothetical protein
VTELLARTTKLAISEVKQAVDQPFRVYVIPNGYMGIFDNTLRLAPRRGPLAHRCRLIFLHPRRDRGHNATGVITRSGSDGTLGGGVKARTESLAQDRGEVHRDAAQRASGCVGFVLPPELRNWPNLRAPLPLRGAGGKAGEPVRGSVQLYQKIFDSPIGDWRRLCPTRKARSSVVSCAAWWCELCRFLGATRASRAFCFKILHQRDAVFPSWVLQSLAEKGLSGFSQAPCPELYSVWVPLLLGEEAYSMP